MKYDLQFGDNDGGHILVPDVKRNSQLKKHPLRQLFPNLGSLAGLLLDDLPEQKAYLIAINPKEEFFRSDSSIIAFQQVGHLAQQVMRKVDTVPLAKEPDAKSAFWEGERGVSEASAIFNGAPVSSFLFDTLLERQRLLGRNGVSYLALRQWRKTIKPYQVRALAAVKLGKMVGDAKAIAHEMSEAVRKVYGNNFDAVVPIPGGSSGRADSLSVQIARNVAKELGVELKNVLVAKPVAKGGSHPRKSAKLEPYQLAAPISGHVLVIDDVATSGKHLELATQALRPHVKHSMAVVWIAD